MKSTHTFAILEISSAAYQEIRNKLKAAGYDHAIFPCGGEEVCDMHGIALQEEPIMKSSQTISNDARDFRP